MRTSRRAALGAILGAPLASVPTVAATPSVSPKLARLIAKHDRINAKLDAACDVLGFGYPRGLIKAAAAMRAQVVRYPCANMADVMAKALCVARLWPVEDLQFEIDKAPPRDGCSMDVMSLGIVMELAMMGGMKPCA